MRNSDGLTMKRNLVVPLLCCWSSLAGAADREEKPAAAPCPVKVTAAITKAFPGAKALRCKVEDRQLEVTLTTKEGSAVEVDVTPEGAILQIEEVVALSAVPPAVLASFGKKFGGATVTRAEKQTNTAKGVFYELAFAIEGRKKEATFAADGAFVDEE